MTTSLKDLLAGLQREYVASIPKKCETIQALWESGNLQDLQTEYHKLKGTGRTYGLPEISQLGEAMEAICLTERSFLESTVAASLRILERVRVSREAGATFAIEEDAEFQMIVGIVVGFSAKTGP